MTRLYLDAANRRYYVLYGGTLVSLVGRTGVRRVISYKATHEACINIGLQLIGTNFKEMY